MKMINAASGGALVNMTPQRARELISTMAVNSQQYRPPMEPMRRVHELSTHSLVDKIDELTNVVKNTLAGKMNPTWLCGIVPGLIIQPTRARFYLGTQLHNKLALTVSCLENQGKLSSQTEPNPRQNASTITVKDGTESKLVLGTSRDHDIEQEAKPVASTESVPYKPFVVPLPYPGRLAQVKKE
ncbi:hypothetical protein CXB51_031324 [Gossypium anomalum]|uniref:Uncharacterized protein n=1 Tax=Gossypium anomalum TaxID=47600 RepID=A0A8J5YBH6_9ROSI|nr:hypothetical protein CXB51_031324 [Gossypium anomalum]